MNRIGQLLDEHIYIMPSPIALAQSLLILFVEAIIVKLLSCNGIRVEVVIDMNSIDIIARDNILHYLANIISILFQRWIQDELSVVRNHTIRMKQGHVIGGQLRRTFCFGSERIYPCMEFHPTLMTLVYHPLKRVPIRRRSHTLSTCEKTAPRFQLTLVKGIALGTHLEDNSIDAVLLKLVQLMKEVLLHSLRTQSLKLPIDTLNPRSPELTFLSRKDLCKGQKKQDNRY